MFSSTRILKTLALSALLGTSAFLATPAAAHEYGDRDGYYDRSDDNDRGRSHGWDRNDDGRDRYDHDRRWGDRDFGGYRDRDWRQRYWWHRHHRFDRERDWY